MQENSEPSGYESAHFGNQVSRKLPFTEPDSLPSRHGAAQHDAWRTIQRSHAIANGLYLTLVPPGNQPVPVPSANPGNLFSGPLTPYA